MDVWGAATGVQAHERASRKTVDRGVHGGEESEPSEGSGSGDEGRNLNYACCCCTAQAAYVSHSESVGALARLVFPWDNCTTTNISSSPCFNNRVVVQGALMRWPVVVVQLYHSSSGRWHILRLLLLVGISSLCLPSMLACMSTTCAVCLGYLASLNAECSPAAIADIQGWL